MTDDVSLPNKKLSLTGSISLATLIAVGLTWSFMVRDLEVLSGLEVLSKNIIIGGIIACICVAYSDYRLKWQVSRQHLTWFLGYFAVIAAVNGHVLMEALACDELYHSGMASLAVRAIEKFSLNSPAGQLFGFRPMTESVGIISFFALTIVIAMVGLGRKLASRWTSKIPSKSLIFLNIWLFSTLVGQLCRTLPYRSEVHPPLRLLPLFVAQSIFGYEDLSFRLPGLLLLAAIATAVACFVESQRTREDGSGTLFAMMAGLLVAMIPTVAHAATIVEPSIWCFGTWMTCFFLLNRYLREDNDLYLVSAAVVLGLGSLMRQNAIVLWPIMGLALLIKRPRPLVWLKVMIPGTFVIPYLLIAANGHHAAASGAGLPNILKSLEGWTGLQYILRSTTPPWVFAAIVLVIYAAIHRQWRKQPGLIVLISIFPAYALYFSISDFLWSLGRYQAEYIGAAIAILIATSFATMPTKWRMPLLAGTTLLAGYSINVLRTLHYDSYYGNWSQKRITTESMYPYREALGFLHRQNTEGAFAFVGGVPTYGWYLFYLRGFSYHEVDKFKANQSKFEDAMQKGASLAQLKQTAKDLGISDIVVQWGDKRELQHRANWHNNVEASLRAAEKDPSSGITREHRFYGALEGAIDIYRVGG